jgi:hypothetical protein
MAHILRPICTTVLPANDQIDRSSPLPLSWERAGRRVPTSALRLGRVKRVSRDRDGWKLNIGKSPVDPNGPSLNNCKEPRMVRFRP